MLVRQQQHLLLELEHPSLVAVAAGQDLVVDLGEHRGGDLVQGHLALAEQVRSRLVEVVDAHGDAGLLLEDGAVEGAL